MSWLFFEMRSSSFLSLHQNNCFKNVRTLERRVFADDKFTCHPENEFVTFSVSNLDWRDDRSSLSFQVFSDPGLQKHQYPGLNLASFA